MTSLSRTASKQLRGKCKLSLGVIICKFCLLKSSLPSFLYESTLSIKRKCYQGMEKSSTLFEKYVSENVWIQCSFSCISCWLISMVLEPAILKGLSILRHTSETLCVTPTVAWRECSALMFLIHSFDFCSLWSRLRCCTNVSGVYGCNIRRVSWL